MKGSTNASGAVYIEIRSITADKLADGALPVVATLRLSDNWTGTASPYTQTFTLDKYTVTNKTKINIQPNATAIAQLIDDGVSALYVQNDSGTLTAVAVGEKPKDDLSLQITIEEVR